jgi:predicted nucleotidyltransferase component of viral defense system
VSLAFIDRTSLTIGIKRKDMLEKDLLLHQILTDLSKEKFFAKNFIFKGGTCLIKNYLGYVRFSEDIDFTWKDQSIFVGKGTNKIRADLSNIIHKVGGIFEEIAAERQLDFKYLKGNKEFVELGGSNKTCTFKIWYISKVLKKKTFIKVQINFVERMCTKPRKGQLKSLLQGKYDELTLFSEYREYSRPITFMIYDIHEILSEKVRALLTREGVKARDFLDIFFIYKVLRIKPNKVEKCIIKKIEHGLGLYVKYRTNLKVKKQLLERNKIFEWGSERDLLLSNLNEKEFYKFITKFTEYLKILVKKFSN